MHACTLACLQAAAQGGAEAAHAGVAVVRLGLQLGALWQPYAADALKHVRMRAALHSQATERGWEGEGPAARVVDACRWAVAICLHNNWPSDGAL